MTFCIETYIMGGLPAGSMRARESHSFGNPG
jgi:hypothetical protein